LPLHAAGRYGQGEEKLLNKAYHHVISSYTPSLSALIHRDTPSGSDDDFCGIATISQSMTAAHSFLPGALAEIDAIQSIVDEKYLHRLDDISATTMAVLQAMEENSWIHFACHGIQHRTDPMKSAFILHDGPLELGSISNKSLPHARFAFLSACQTATGDESLPEEAVHLAAGMLMAGYRSVIGTMWSIRDQDGPVIAKEVYRHLTPLMETGNGQTAKALHQAVKILREKNGEQDFLSWIPFVHFGT
jgi:CHAT domain-containing protein